MTELPPLQLDQTIGFNGTITNGYQVHPNGYNLVYALGTNLVISEPGGIPTFLIGHSGHVTTFAISKCGRYIASGEQTQTGFPAYIIIWDFMKREQIHKLKQHNGSVFSLSFSPSSDYMVSLGGLDDKNVVVWNVKEGRALCGSPIGIEAGYYVKFFNNSDESFISGGLCQPRVWDIDYKNTKLIPNDIQLGHIRRVTTCAAIDENDEIAYVGTSTGDILAIHVQNYLLKHTGPSKAANRLQEGCTAICLYQNGRNGPLAVAAGSGNGDVFCYEVLDPYAPQQPLFKIIGKTRIMGKVTSITVRPFNPAPPKPKPKARTYTVTKKKEATNGPPKKIDPRGRVVPIATAQRSLIPRQTEAVRPAAPISQSDSTYHELLCGTDKATVYSVISPTMQADLQQTCHVTGVNGVAFPPTTAEIFASCADGDIRLWHLPTSNELLRIEIPNQNCLCCCFNPAGSEIISGWSDGKIRSFGPESGRLLYVINDAHKQVTSITTLHKTPMLVSGGSEGQVRVWKLTRDSQTLVATMKEHRQRVNSVKVTNDDSECVSVSDDGTAFTWSLERYLRLKHMMKATNFKCVDYLPDCTQLVTCSTDRTATYWDAYEGSLLRELPLSDLELFALAIDPSGTLMAVGGSDKVVRIVDYDEGKVLLMGEGHPEKITCLTWSPDGRKLVSGSADGSIFIWNLDI
ncbi:putative Cilia- and flagella-associated protein 52 [Blattamonas nauphoetae]|uniref:Cilia- and flagella-associated protein 52 n=1 Tax=Blattamonas nauphoetae TaxID=2049346 RepID=A0ABQ9Y9N0_9EUKA|nr:putative Cilia- and flagella-associated protein 52 [Blattamonas nauphoetae]